MDNVTHALAGLLLAEATVVLASRRAPVSAGFRRAALILGVACAELPDADLVYAGPALGMGKLGYMLHHRGHTHTVVFALLGALAAWGIALAIARGVRERPHERRWLLGLAAAGTLVAHLTLDWTNSYGVHPFWPVDNRWFYGDSIFIIEPWLFVAAIPPLLVLARGWTMRVFLALALVGIVALTWRTSMVGPGIAPAVTVGAALWLAAALLARRGPRERLVLMGVVAWVVVEATYATTSRLARARVREAVGTDGVVLEDAAITPLVGNPLCHDALVVERRGTAYRVTRATVAALPGVRSVASCSRGRGIGQPSRAATGAVRWGEAWHEDLGELARLARERCEVAAALRFIRVPTWERLPGGGVRIADLRYNRGGGGFAELVVDGRAGACTGPIPPWVPPRQRLLDADAE